MRRKIKHRAKISPDPRFQSELVEKFVNHLMYGGKKNAARRIIYDAFSLMKDKSKGEEPLKILETAMRNVSPVVEVRSRRVGGATYQVPREVRPERKATLAMRWIIQAARSKKGKPMAEKISEELLAASRNEGAAVKKREDTHKMAEANRAFAHFAW
ncbi:30S ribosomal protein S7 [Candidatus Giovannonibacteria bacterium]|nr:30S ribosomal protein S7 [Candidatus Giovannonibacteria bacterium]